MKLLHRVVEHTVLAQVVLAHVVAGHVGAHTQGIAQVVVLAVPHQEPLALGVLPEVGVLVLAQGIHAVVAVDVGVQELHAVVNHGVPAAHGDAVDVGKHGGVHGEAVGPEIRLPLGQALFIDFGVQKVGEVQVVGGHAQLAHSCQAAELLLLLLRGILEELLHAEQRLAVPAEFLVLGALHEL